MLVAAVIAGCGSSLSSPVALRQHATAICKRTSRSIGVTSAPTSLAELSAFLARGIGNLEIELAKLRRLRASSGDVGAVYAAALRALAAELPVLRAATGALRRGQDPVLAVRNLQRQLTPLEQQADAAWQALQIPACLER